MAQGKFIAYYRVSTVQQGRSGLGLEAQQKAVLDYLNGNGWELIEEYTEVESGKKASRPELMKALAACRLHDAVLVIAKLDRLSRDAHFLLGIQNSKVKFCAVDMPEANEMVVGIMAIMAEHERRMISQRTRVALAAAKARGVKLGKPENLTDADRRKGAQASALARAENVRARNADLLPVIETIREDGITSLNGIAQALNRRKIGTPRRSLLRSSAAAAGSSGL